MKRRKLSRRDILKGSLKARPRWRSAPCSPLPSAPQAPAPDAITPALIEAAKKEGKVVLYSSMDLPVGEKLGKAFEAHIPASTVQIERSGSERLFQRIDQEFASNIRAADIVNSLGRLALHQLEEERLADAVRAGRRRQAFSGRAIAIPTACPRPRAIWLSSIAYNTNLVKPEDAPKSFADLLDPKWAGKMVKGHPGL